MKHGLGFELFLGLRYLSAKRRRRSLSFSTAISIGGVTVGVAALIATLAVMTGFKEDLRDKILGTNSHIVITDRTRDTIKDYKEVIAKASGVPHVVSAAPFIYRQVLLSSESNVHGVVLRGIDPRREAQVTDIARNMIEGRLEDLEQTGPPGILLGKELAIRLGTFLGQQIHVLSPAGSGSAAGRIGPLGITPKFKKFIVVGIFESGMYEYDSTLAYVAIPPAQEFFDLGDEVTGVEVKVDDIFAADRIAGEIEKRLSFPFWARDWMRLNKNLFSALKLEKIMMFIVLVLIILVASFNIVSTLMMIVVEKRGEIAILKAMGARREEILRVFMLEGLIIGGVGVALGVPLGYAICWALQQFYSLPPDIYYISRIPVIIRTVDVSLVALSAIAISFLATIYPSWQAAQLNPAEALRYE